eukprot:jgi/Mesvir1/11607/Mv00016-RA.1
MSNEAPPSPPSALSALIRTLSGKSSRGSPRNGGDNKMESGTADESPPSVITALAPLLRANSLRGSPRESPRARMAQYETAGAGSAAKGQDATRSSPRSRENGNRGADAVARGAAGNAADNGGSSPNGSSHRRRLSENDAMAMAKLKPLEVPSPKTPGGGSKATRRPSVVESYLHDDGAPLPLDMDQTTKMLYYAGQGNLKMVSQLLRAGASVNTADYDGRTPLHLASSEGKVKMVELLVKSGANVNSKDRWGGTPYTDAAHFGFEDVLDFLKKNGARPPDEASMHASPRAMSGAISSALPGSPLASGKWEWEIDPTELNLSQGVRIGRGAFGEIIKLKWRGTEVAVKKMLANIEHEEQALKEFRDEISLLPKLLHPHIVQFLGGVTLSHPLMIVTEFCGNGNLHDIMSRGRLRQLQVVNYALDIARGVNYLHLRKPAPIVHRDLKPRNILVADSGHLKVGDFGLSKLLQTTNMEEQYQMTGETGSYRYMAPEVFKHKPYDKSVDVYSFAIILYEMVEGAPAYQYTPPAVAASAAALNGLRPKMTLRLYPPALRE